MSLLQTLLERNAGMKHLARKPDEDGKRHYMRAISYTAELRRIELLPRREWTDEAAEQLAMDFTRALKTENGTMKLWPIQGVALAEVLRYDGLFGPIAVGEGKALVSLLAPVLLDAKRPLLLVPAALRDQTLRDVIPKMRKHWRLHSKLLVRGFSEISLEKNAKLLDTIKPDVIVLDEAHYVKQKSAGRTKRLTRYLRENPTVRVVAMSGTISNRSIKDWAHIAEWTLKHFAPIPNKWQELSEWADCLDADVPDDQRPLPGALNRFCVNDETPREGFRRRLVQTPGVVASKDNRLGCSLRIISHSIAYPGAVHQALNRLRQTWETPNGDPIIEAVALWRHAQELALGFWYRWDPPPPEDWMTARRAWKKYVREVLKTNRRGLDTELQVFNESKLREQKEWREWVEVKDTYTPNTVAEWIDDFAVKEASDLLHLQDAGICWYQHAAFGEALAQYTGYPLFGAGDNSIIDCPDKRILASIGAHSEGKNLQRWCYNLVVAPPSSGKRWEQLLGRTHRHGQQADEVVCEVFQHVPELQDCFAKAQSEARYLEETYGNRQKLNYADMVNY